MPIQAAEGATIIDAAKENNINIPSLCYLKGVHKFGTCRICVVEVKGAKTLQASCMTEVREGMEVETNSLRVRNARRVLYELLLSDHSKECLTCSRNQSCELQELGKNLGVDTTRFEGERLAHIIDTSISITRDMTKCILCRRCVTACNQIQGIGAINAQNRGFATIVSPAMDLPLGDVSCIFCGQCTVVCPVGALKETDSINKVWNGLFDKTKRTVAQVAPAVRVTIGEEFGLPAGSRVTGKLAASLRALGFDDVFDTNFGADLTILEEGTELLTRLKKAVAGESVALPMITSCSPGWVKYIEHAYPEKLAHLSTCKAPHTMLGALVKSYYAQKIKTEPQDMFVVSVMPCTAKKFEIERPEMVNNGVANVDAVITTRELGDMIKQAGIDFCNLADIEFDHPLGLSTGAADIFGLTGGVMEAALRTVYELVTGRELPFEGLHVTPIVGLDSIKTADILIEHPLAQYSQFDGVTIKVAVTSGTKGAKQLMEEVRAGTSPYHFIEIMGCPNGCIMGGGQPRSADLEVRQKRLKGLYKEDESKVLRKSHENPYIISLYEEYLGIPCGQKSHELLHTHYVKRGQFNEFTEERFTVKTDKQTVSAPKKESIPLERVSPEAESLKVLALEGEITRLKRECEEHHETIELFKKYISDAAKPIK